MKVETENSRTQTSNDTMNFKSGYSEVNGLKMYYEVYGEGKPLVLLHGGGSTIQTSFGRIIPLLAKHRQVIGVELQAHGRTGDRDADLSFEQDADDVAGLLNNMGISKADFLGFSNGGVTLLHLAIRHPNITGKIIVCSALSKRSGAPAQFWDFMRQAKMEHMPQQYKDAYLEVAPAPGGLQTLHDKCAKRMVDFRDIPDAHMQSIKSPALIVMGNADVATPEHAVEMYRLIPDCQLAILPGGHGKYLGEITTLTANSNDSDYLIVPLAEDFLNSVSEKQ